MFMTVLLALKFAIPLLAATAAALNKAGLANEALAIGDAVSKLQSVHDTVVTKGQLESFRLDPDDWSVQGAAQPPTPPPAQPGS